MPKRRRKAMRKLVAYRLSPNAKKLVEKMSAKLGVTQLSIVELAIRRMAKSEDVTLEGK